MADEDGFLHAIRERPDDDLARLVYADWLDEGGGVRGEYLRLEHQAAQIARRMAELREQIDPTWLADVQRPSPVVGAVLAGRWTNVLGDTGGWVRLDVATDGAGWTIRVWSGPDVQGEVSWREWQEQYAGDPDHAAGPFVPPPAVTLHVLADGVCDTEMKYGFASWDHGFADEHLTLRLAGIELIVEDFTVFKDDSGRSHYRVRETFRKPAAPNPPD